MRQLLLSLLSILLFFSGQLDAKKTIGIFTSLVQGANPWDPDSVKSGITGSEEAVIYMSQKLASLGYEVLVLGSPPENSLHSLPSANPRFVSNNFQITSKLDIAIAWRLPDLGTQLKNLASKIYLWPHDTWTSSLTDSQINSFDDVLWISNWQREQWMSINPGFAKFTKIFGNGINPEQFSEVQERKNPYSCIYASNYSRGLEVLLEIWPEVKKEFPKATLDIYYGWQHWGLLSPEKEDLLRKQVKNLKRLDVHEHGLVGHEELTKAFAQSSFWTYPCTAAETFCITALKAQLSGAIPVIIQHTGLKETVRSGFGCLQPREYLKTLKATMSKANNFTVADRKKAGEFILQEFTWEKLALKWKELFDSQDSSKKTICLNMIVKNESPVIRRCLASVKNLIDYWVIVDTGSTDGTQKIIQEFMKDIPGELHERPWINFAHNRDEALKLCKEKANYLLFIDADEELFFSKDFALPTLDQDYYYSVLKLNSSSCHRKLLVNNHLNWKWEGVLHEQLLCPEATTSSLLSGVVNSAEAMDGHRSQDPQKHLHDAKTLEVALEKEPNNARHTFYLAQSYMQAKEYLLALKNYEKVVSINDTTISLYPALYNIGILSELLGASFEKITNSYCKAAQNSPTRIEPLFRLSVYYFTQQNYVMGYSVAKSALNMPNPHERLYNEDWIYEYGILFAFANSAFSLGKYDEAQTAYEQALKAPNLPKDMSHEIEKNLTSLRLQLQN